MDGFAWVTLATNDSYGLGALVLGHSLRQNETLHELVVLVTPGVTNHMRESLKNIFNQVIEVNVLDSKDEANLKLLSRPELGVTFTKLHCWRLTQYQKCVFLDADTMVLGNADELFEREELSAAPDVGWPDCFNSGVFVYVPSNDTYNSLINFALSKGSFDGGDQGLLNMYFSDWAHKDINKHLPFIYNMCSTACYSYLPAFKQFGSDVKIVHFIAQTKPWMQIFDPETRQVKPSHDLSHLTGLLQHWWNIFCSAVHPKLSPDMAPSKRSSAYPVNNSSHYPDNTNYYNTPTPTYKEQNYHQTIWDPWDEYDEKQFESSNETDNISPNESSSRSNQNDNDNYYHKQNDDYNNIQNNFEHNTNILGESLENYNPPQFNNNDHFFENNEGNGNNSNHNVEVINVDNSIYHSSEKVETNYVPIQFETSNSVDTDNFNYQHNSNHLETRNVEVSNRFENFVTENNNYAEELSSNNEKNTSSSTPNFSQNKSRNTSECVAKEFEQPFCECEPASSLTQQNTIQPSGDAGTVDESGFAGAFARLTLGEPRSAEQSALEDHLRRQGWEIGNIDYMNKDSFGNIWNKICQTLATGPSSENGKETETESKESVTEQKEPQSSQTESEQVVSHQPAIITKTEAGEKTDIKATEETNKTTETELNTQSQIQTEVVATLVSNASTEVKTAETSAVPSTPTEVKTAETSAVPSTPTEVKTAETSAVPSIPTEGKPTETSAVPSSPTEVKAAETNTVPSTPTEVKPAETCAVPSTPTEVKTVETGAVPSTPTEIKTVETGAVPSTPTEVKPVESSAVSSTPTEVKTAETGAVPSTPTEVKPAESSAVSSTPTEVKTAETSAVPSTPTEVKPGETCAVPSSPTEVKPAETSVVPSTPIEVETNTVKPPSELTDIKLAETSPTIESQNVAEIKPPVTETEAMSPKTSPVDNSVKINETKPMESVKAPKVELADTCPIVEPSNINEPKLAVVTDEISSVPTDKTCSIATKKNDEKVSAVLKTESTEKEQVETAPQAVEDVQKTLSTPEPTASTQSSVAPTTTDVQGELSKKTKETKQQKDKPVTKKQSKPKK